jgi:hypothetical protein
MIARERGAAPAASRRRPHGSPGDVVASCSFLPMWAFLCAQRKRVLLMLGQEPGSGRRLPPEVRAAPHVALLPAFLYLVLRNFLGGAGAARLAVGGPPSAGDRETCREHRPDLRRAEIGLPRRWALPSAGLRQLDQP